MRSTEECVQLALHKAAVARARRERLVGTAAIGLCALLGVGIIVPLALGSAGWAPTSGPGLSGASLFGDGAGGYVLVGLVSCVVAVAVTLALVRRRGRSVTPADASHASANDETYQHAATDEEM